MKLNKINEFYKGIVIRNDDPEKRGRVQLYIPSLNQFYYDLINKETNLIEYKFPGKLFDTENIEIQNDLNSLWPLFTNRNNDFWASPIQPLIGCGGTGTYNAKQITPSISDGNMLEKVNSLMSTDGSDVAPAELYQQNAQSISDPFTDPKSNILMKVNPNGNDYSPNYNSNSAPGAYSVPSVGAHVLVGFFNGNFHEQFFIGYMQAQPEYWSHYVTDFGTGIDYPDEYENVTSQ